MQKLIRSRGTLKDTLDKLASSGSGQKEALPPRRSLTTSANVLQSAGEKPSRAKVTQDLVEFSHSHGGERRRRNRHSNNHGAKKQ